ncbi:MAG: DNA cytosine methyltransferase [Patescibacteria group bacterium]
MAKKYKFIDLFAGIGGFHIAFDNVGAKCVWVSEWDKYARQTYEANFKTKEPGLFRGNNFVGDITKVEPSDIPNFDILTGGFPCQPFSQAGKKKGFEETRGTLFFDIVKILEAKKPKAFFLENVRGLINHNSGETFATIKRVIEEELGYSFYYKLVKASEYGLPTHRPRLYMVGFRDKNVPFEFPKPIPLKFTMSDVLGGKANKEVGYTLRVGGRGSGMNDRRNWDTYRVDGKIRRLNSKEGARLMGFPEDFIFPVSETQAMKQLGNSVAIPAIQATAKEVIKSLRSYYG